MQGRMAKVTIYAQTNICYIYALSHIISFGTV